MSTAEDVLSVALSLPPEDRAVIAERLLASLDSEAQPSPSIDAIWAEEIVARAVAFEQGKVRAIPWREAMADVRRRCAW